MGYTSSDGVYTVVGWMALHPSYSRHGLLSLVRSHRALKGWRRLEPPRSRIGVTIFVVSAVAAELIRRRRPDMAVWIMISHLGYLRPSSNMALRRRCLVTPKAGACDFWSLLLNSWEYKLVSKPGTTDDAVLLDGTDYAWLAPKYREMIQGDPNEKLWTFTYFGLVKEILAAASAIGINLVPYQLRHSGSSWERLRNERSLQEVQTRGRWRSFASVTRYEKVSRLLSEYDKIPVGMREWMEDGHRFLRQHESLSNCSMDLLAATVWNRCGGS